MPLTRSAVGIDLGAHAIKIVNLRVSAAGAAAMGALLLERRALAAAGLVPGDPASLARILRAHLSQARIPARGVVLGIGGQDAVLRYTRTPPVPAWRLKVIMDYEFGGFAERIGEPLASDFRLLPLVRELEEDQTILIAHAKEKPLGDLLDALEAEGITVARAVPSPIALFNAGDAMGKKPPPDAEGEDLLLLLDLGAENLNLALVLNGRLVFARSVTFGGKNFTEALAARLGVEAAEAERIKIARGGLDDGEKSVLLDAVAPLRNVAGQLLSTVQASFRFATTQTGAKLPALSRTVLLGGGMRLRGMASFLRQGLGAPAEFFEPASLRLADGVSEEAEKVLSSRPGEFGVALGLGVSRLREASGDEGVSTISILPARYLKRREFRERTLFLYVAAALLVVLLLGRLVYGVLQNHQAAAVERRLAENHRVLSSQKQEMMENAAQAEAGRARLNHLLKEAEQTAFQALVLDTLGRVLRPEMQLERIWWTVTPAEKDDGEEEYVLRVSGRVNNEKRQGVDWTKALLDQLKLDERIGAAEIEASRPEGAWYTFEFAVRPRYVMY
jgi:type IV pilus assembly protein PilM